MTEAVIVQVPIDQAPELRQLIADAGQPEQEVLTSHAFDGATVVEAALALTSTAIPVLITWIKARAAIRKNSKVVFRNGPTLSGYTAREVARIIAQIEGETGESRDS